MKLEVPCALPLVAEEIKGSPQGLNSLLIKGNGFYSKILFEGKILYLA